MDKLRPWKPGPESGHSWRNGKFIAPTKILTGKKFFSLEFSEMLDLVRFTDCHTSFTQDENKFIPKVDEEAPYMCQIQQGSENEDDGPYLFHYSTFY